jgi:hypothetical protein
MALYYIDSNGDDTQLLIRGAKLLSLAKNSRFRQGAVAAFQTQSSRRYFFDATPSNKSSDAGGGGVFRKIIGSAVLAPPLQLNRWAARWPESGSKET